MNVGQEHTTVLLNEAVDSLITDVDGYYVDGTFGRGGHSGLILKRLSENGYLFAMDKDAQAVAAGSLQFAGETRFELQQGSFCELGMRLKEQGQVGNVSGILLDLGVSSPQLDQAERGFSFQKDGPLDMRMDQSRGQTAAEWLNRTDEREITRVLKEYGEERFARRIARAILAARDQLPLTTTRQLASIIAEANPVREKGRHPATRTFQAIRIAINRELEDLDQVLVMALEILAVGGRLVVISFHSLEDRRVKRFIRHHEKGDELPVGVPVTKDALNQRLHRVGKVVRPGTRELDRNPRARSAVMRVAEKVA